MNRLRRQWPLLLGLLVSLVVLWSEPTIVDLFCKGHVNWVSLHSLAIARHSTAELGGVGYSCRLMPEPGRLTFEYFNRYPIPFAVLSHWVLRPWQQDPASWLLAARQWMNLIFLATLASLFALLRVVGASRVLAVAAVLGTAVMPVVLQYKTMFHFDQPVLLAYGLVAAVAVRCFSDRSVPGWAYLISLSLGVLAGRSAILLCFAAALVVLYPRRSLAWIGMALSFGLVAVTTAYNIAWEAWLRSVPLPQTSVVESALRRLSLSEEGFDPELLERTRLTWRAFHELLDNLMAYISPVLVLTLIALVLLVLFRRRPPWDPVQDPTLKARRRLAWQSTGIASLLWLPLMKNLLVFHVYAAMVLLPLLTLVLLFSLERFCAVVPRWQKTLPPALAATLVSVFLFQVGQSDPGRLRPSFEREQLLAAFLKDVGQFTASTPLDQPVDRSKKWIPGSPFAQCALLDQPLWSGDDAVAPSLATPPPFPDRPR